MLPSEPGCNLCGLPCGATRLELATAGSTYHFCCSGCQHVFEILFHRPEGMPADLEHDELYRSCVAAGLIPALSGGETPAPERVPAAGEDTGIAATLRIEGMWCAACAWLIEAMLRRVDGVLSAEVSFLTDLVRIRYLPHRVALEELSRPIAPLGYRLGPAEALPAAGERESFVRLGVAAILSMHLMMLSFALYGGFFQELEVTGIRVISGVLWLLATVVVFYSGWPILARAGCGLSRGHLSMDTLIAAGTLAAYGLSFYQMAIGSLHLYFDTAGMLVTLVLLGKFIETAARGKVTRGMGRLQEIIHGKARILRSDRPHWVPATTLAPGDSLVVEKGERVPVDGRVAAGRAEVDEAVLTGESRPKSLAEGDDVLAGSLVLDGRLRLTATRIGQATSVGQMADLVEQAMKSNNELERFTDRLIRWFVPLIFAVAIIVGVGLLLRDASLETALLRAVTVLVISCPCALGIATPLAKVAVISRGRARGIVIRNPAALEQARNLDVLVFDKTGTVTEGNYALRVIHAFGGDEGEVLARVAALEAGADHFLAREIGRQAKARGLNPPAATGVEHFPGLGLKGWVDGRASALPGSPGTRPSLAVGREVVVGNRRLMATLGMAIPPALSAEATATEGKGLTVIHAAWQGEVRALLSFGDALRPGMGRLMERLREEKRSLWLVSGDSRDATMAVARELGIEQARGETLPEDKAALVRQLRNQGLRVGMVGDGVNDAAALAEADVGFAVGGSPGNLMEEAADVTVFGPLPERLPEVFTLSRLMVSAIGQNLFLAFLYNGIAIPLAVAGLFNPLMAVLAMVASSLTVIGNTMRVAGRAKASVSPSQTSRP